MKVLIVAPFYEPKDPLSRPFFVQKCLSTNSISRIVLTSDFSHSTGLKRNISNAITLKTIPYKSNVSLIRFISHLLLSIKMGLFILQKHNQFTHIYITLPLCFPALVTSLICRKKLIIDIVDLWPGSLPFPKKIKKAFKPFFYIWEHLNKFVIRRANKVISLSSFFINDSGVSNTGRQILLGSKSNLLPISLTKSRTLNLVYIGNLGSLYDFETLINSISNLNFSVHLDIIGRGDKYEWLISELAKRGIGYSYHGVIYSNEELVKVFSRADFGFNGFKGTTATLSYKSVTYLSYGLPIINSMNGDLSHFVNEYQLGFNYKANDESSLTSTLEAAFYSNEMTLKSNVHKFFLSHLFDETVNNSLLEVFNYEKTL